MWWREVQELGATVARRAGPDSAIDAAAMIEPGSVLDDSSGPIRIGPRTKVCAGAIVRGPAVIGAGCLIGNQALVRGPVLIGDRVRIGFSTEIKHALIGDEVAIGPMCFVADSLVGDGAYLGALVRTSNQRLDRMPIAVQSDEGLIKTDCPKLGCLIGARASLGIQVIVLPGRVIAPDTTFEPRVTVSRNYPAGHYRVQQAIEEVKPV